MDNPASVAIYRKDGTTPIFLSEEFLGRSKHIRTDARFWVTLICAFSGMRLNEAYQLYLDDIRQDNAGI
jgi:intergrase/recombinase